MQSDHGFLYTLICTNSYLLAFKHFSFSTETFDFFNYTNESSQVQIKPNLIHRVYNDSKSSFAVILELFYFVLKAF